MCEQLGNYLFQSHWWPASPCCDAEDAGVLLQGRGPSLAHCPPYKKQMGLEQALLHHGSLQHLGDLPSDRDNVHWSCWIFSITTCGLQEVLSFAHSWVPGRVMLSPSSRFRAL